MHDKLAKLMAKKKDAKPMSDVEKHAKLGVVQSLADMADQAMKDHIGGLKKVSVASNSNEGLEHGLDKAKEVLSQHEHDDLVHQAEDNHYSDKLGDDSDEQEDESPDASDASPAEAEEHAAHEASESPEEEHSEHDDMDEEELNKKLEHLMRLKAKKSKK